MFLFEWVHWPMLFFHICKKHLIILCPELLILRQELNRLVQWLLFVAILKRPPFLHSVIFMKLRQFFSVHSDANLAKRLHIVIKHLLLPFLIDLPLGSPIHFLVCYPQITIFSFLKSSHAILVETLDSFSLFELFEVVLASS